MDARAFNALSCGVYIISAAANGKNAGCIVNTVTQVTAQPARLLAAVNKDNYTAGVIRAAGAFEVSVLTQDAPMALIAAFGFASSADTDKFAQAAHRFDAQGMPYVTQDACSRFACRVTDVIDAGTHLLFIGEVTQAERLSDAPPMTYAYYHAVKKGTTPPKASSYQPAAPAKAAAWRCTVCGYIYEGEALPAGFACPVCGKGAEFFEKV